MNIFNKISDTFGGNTVRQLLKGIGANAIGKAWVLLIQLTSIPVLSSCWGGDGFGTWLMLSAIPTYIAISANSFGSAAATEMTHNYSKNDYDSAAASFQSAWLLITTFTVLAAGLFIAGSLSIGIFASNYYSENKIIIISASLFSIHSLISIQTALISTGYRASGRYALGTLLVDLISLIEACSVLVMATLGYKYIGAITAMMTIRIVLTIPLLYWITKREPWFAIGTHLVKRVAIQRLWRPSLGIMSLTISNALSLQGVIVVLGAMNSPSLAASYSTARTLCRTPLQISDLVGRASVPELTLSMARGDLARFKKLTLLNVAAAIIVVLPTSIIIAFMGPEILTMLSKNNLNFEPMLFPLLALATCAQGIWLSVSQSLAAVNRQHSFSHTYLFLSTALVMGSMLAYRTTAPASAVAALSAVCEIITLALIMVRTKLALPTTSAKAQGS